MKPDPNALEQLSFYLGRAYYNYVGLLERELARSRLDLHLRPGMGHALFVLFEGDLLPIKTLAVRTMLSPSTLTGMLDRMERAGIVSRAADPADGRSVLVRLTPLGRSLEPRCRELLRRVNRVLHAGMAEPELRRLKRSLAKSIEAMRTEETRKRGEAV